MELIKRTTLLYQDRTSDKVYEVDLARIGKNSEGVMLYAVNFRYGRRGKTMREGAETAVPVPEGEAIKAFDRLIASKIRKGYWEVTRENVSALEPKSEERVESQEENNLTPREQAILTRLRAAVAALKSQKGKIPVWEKGWPLERVIWRVGELKLCQAVPLLIKLLTPDPIRRYCTIWALGNCGDASVVPQLEAIYQDRAEQDRVRRIALEAIFKLSPIKKREFQASLEKTLPEELTKAIETRNTEEFGLALQKLLARGDAEDFGAIDIMYQIDSELIRPFLLKLLREAPFEPNYFQRIRHIFKAAEYRADAEVFGILARRFEQEGWMHTKNNYAIDLKDGTHIYRYDYNKYNSRTRQYEENPRFIEMMETNSGYLAYSDRTKKYLQDRIWRTLKTLGELGRKEYVELAAAVLLEYIDENAGRIKNISTHRWENGSWVSYPVKSWDRYASYITFNQILYRNSPRYKLLRNSQAWVCQSNYKPGDPSPTVREEAFPELWTQQPDILLKILLNSRCEIVQEFAIKAIRSRMDFCQGLSLETLIKLLEIPYEQTAEFAFKLTGDRYDPKQPNLDLVRAMVNCSYQPARTLAYQWMRSHSKLFLAQPYLIASLIVSRETETRIFVRNLLQTNRLKNELARDIVACAIAIVIACSPKQVEIVTGAIQTLNICFHKILKSLDFAVIIDLLKHPLAEVQIFGAEILLNTSIAANNLPKGLIEALLDSPIETVRAIGVQLFGRLPDEQIATQILLVQSFLTHELAEVRAAILPCIRRLTTNNVTFRQEIVSILLAVLQHPEVDEEIAQFVLEVLQKEIPSWMNAVSREKNLEMLQTQAYAAQEMGGHILQANHRTWSNNFVVNDLLQLIKHQVLVVRNAAKEIIQLQLPQLRQDRQKLGSLVNILDTDWEDARIFGRKFFGEWLEPNELSPAILINICDSNRPDVRKFGRDLVSRCFQTQDGEEYLVKLSEHPVNDMQLFATQYLETYASGNVERLKELTPYFTRVLGQVNRAKVAKGRIYSFLDREAIKSETAAKLIAEILIRQSALIAIGDRAKSIEILCKIHSAYPHLSLPIAVKPVPIKK
jgi:HEAT repeat protein